MKGYKFKSTEGRTLVIRFKHIGTRKNKPPKSTICTIFDGEMVVGEGVAKPLIEFPEIFVGHDASKKAFDAYGKRVKKLLKDDKGHTVAIIRGDSFSYARGRKEALKKALDECCGFGVDPHPNPLTREDRRRAWEAVLSATKKE